jgi:hypothetical protein
MQEVGVCAASHTGLPQQLQLASSASHNSATISLTSSAPRGSRGSSRGSSVEESSLETEHGVKSASSGASGGDAEEACSPMDLSSTPVAPGCTSLKDITSSPSSMPSFLELDHPLLNPRKFAELVKAQHMAQQQQQQNETTPPNLPKKRPFEVSDVNESESGSSPGAPDDDSRKPLIPLELIRAKFDKARSPEGSESSSGSNPALNLSSSTPTLKRDAKSDAKKRRLDALLNKKFFTDELSPGERTQSESPEAPKSVEPVRRDSTERKANRRKQQKPQTSPSPPSLTFQQRPSLPNLPINLQSLPNLPNLPISTREEGPKSPVSSKLSIRPSSELLAATSKASPTLKVETEMPDNTAADAIKGQILQLQIAQAALLSGAASAAGGAAANPLLYYGYYAQMIQSFQTQQHRLVEDLLNLQKKKEQDDLRKKSADDIIKNLMNGDKRSPNLNGFKLPSTPVVPKDVSKFGIFFPL